MKADTLLFVADEDEANLHELRSCADARRIPHRTLSATMGKGLPGSAHIRNRGAEYEIPTADGRRLELDRIASVWTRGGRIAHRPPAGKPLPPAHHEWLCYAEHLIDALSHAFWMNPLEAIRRNANRLGQMAIARRHGLRIPESLVTSVPMLAKAFLHRLGNVIARRIAPDSQGAGAEWPRPHATLGRADEALLDHVRHCPVLLQERVPSAAQFRVIVVDDRVFAAGLETPPDDGAIVDSRHWIEADRCGYRADLGSATHARLVQVVREMGLVYGAIDLILTPANELVFLEASPAGQWSFAEMFSGHAITEAIVERLRRGRHA